MVDLKQIIANDFVRIAFRSFDVDSLTEMLKRGEGMAPEPEVNAMNEALRKEIERRKEVLHD